MSVKQKRAMISDDGMTSYEAKPVVTEQLEPETEPLLEELDSANDRYLRALADFDDYRRRVKRERATAERSGKRELLLSLLEVVDDFDRAIEYMAGESGPVAEGLRMIHQRFQILLQANGVRAFNSKGLVFDPNVHEAIRVEASDKNESGTVYEEERRGYLWDEELLRPARVSVVR